MRFNQKLRSEEGRDYWVTSDLHFFHKNVSKFCPDTRKPIIEEDMEAIIEDWNSKVKEHDVIFHLGDFSFAGKEKTEYVLSRLNGEKVFILGNHDKVLRNSMSLSNCFDYLEVNFDGTKVVMCHFPLATWNQVQRGAVMLHGHCHSSYQGKGRILDVGWDNLGEVVSLKDAVNTCLGKDIYAPDHHRPQV